MPYKNESMLMGMDASADTSTQLCFDPPEGPFDASNVVMGEITGRNDEDWIAIKLTEGNEYTITVGGSQEDGELNDSVLKLMDGKGGLISMNDDTDAGKGMLGSTLKFTPEAGSGTQVYFISVSGYTGNPGANNTGAYTVEVDEVAVLPAGEGADIAATSDADHKLTGTSASESIAGMGGDDTIYGGGGDDTLSGGGGNDLLDGGPGADTLKGGAGDMDTISYKYSPEGVTINLADGMARGGDADGDTIVDMGDDQIENIMGSMHDDSLTGNSRANSIWGLAGDDDLDGGRRDDMLYGGAGDDDLDGGTHDDTLEGGYGADMLTGGDHSDMGDTASYSMSMMGVTVRLHSGQAMGGDAEGDVFAGLGTPVEYTDSDEEMTEASVFDIENLTGSAMADILAGDLRDNTIKGGDGDDKIYGGPNPADADKEPGANPNLTNADTLMGQGGNDMIFGGVGNDTLDGGDGDDMLNGGAGADTFMGGAGDDMIYADASDIYDVTNGTRAFKTASLPIINGGEGNDTVSFAKLEDAIGAQGAVFTLGLLDNDDGTGTATIIDGVENVIGTQGDDFITGNAADNVIEGGEGADTLAGGDSGSNTLSYKGSDDRVRVTLRDVANTQNSFIDASRGHASGDKVLTAQTFANIIGSAFDDDLAGNSAVNVLKGLAGDDTIEGNGGHDTIEGGAGADELDGGYTPVNADGNAAGDPTTDDGNRNFEANTLSYASSNAGVTVNLATASASGGHATGDTIVTYEELAPIPDDLNNEIDVATFANITGSMHDDHLTGNHHNNWLEGGVGDDTLRGGGGIDLVIGGPGADMLDGGEDMNEKDNMVPNPDFDDTSAVSATNPEMVAASFDMAAYKSSEDAVTVDLSANRGTAGDAMGDTLVNIELIWGSEKDDTFIAGPGGDIIEGDGGSDTVSYEASDMGVRVDLDDTTIQQHLIVSAAGTGDDLVQFPVSVSPITGPASAAALLALPGIPRLDAMGNPFVDQNNDGIADTGDNIEDEDDNPNANGAAGDKLRSIENLTGSAQKDVLGGDAQNNIIKGMGGDDMLDGGAGGVDKLYGGDGADILTGSGSDGDMLDGGSGDDTITGSTGADTITGGAGNDDLSGGTGNDTFVFSTDDAGDSDAILDFEGNAGTVSDMIDLSAFGLTTDQVKGAITLRGNATDGAYIVINLEEFGGGRITVDNIADLDALDTEADGATGDTPDAIDTLSVAMDLNGDGVFTTADETTDNMDYNGDGDMDDASVSEAGIFIL